MTYSQIQAKRDQQVRNVYRNHNLFLEFHHDGSFTLKDFDGFKQRYFFEPSVNRAITEFRHARRLQKAGI